MNLVGTVANQVFIMGLYIALGFILSKFKFLTQVGTKQMSDLLVKIVTPCVIIVAFQNGYDSKSMYNFFIAALLTFFFHVFSILIEKIVYLKTPNQSRNIVDRFCSVYSNCGFMGIPLLQAALGDKGVFFGSAYLAIFNIFTWTQGYGMFKKSNEKSSFVKALLNPGVIGLILAFVLLIIKINAHSIITVASPVYNPAMIISKNIITVVTGINLLNTPVAMLLLGIYLAESDIVKALKVPRAYVVCLQRLIILPVIAVLCFKLFSVDKNVATAVIISASCPCAAISAIFAAQFGRDYGYASSIVAVSTLLSLVTLPAMSYISSLIL